MDCVRYRQFVGIFYLVAETYAACDVADFQFGKLLEAAGEVEQRRFTLDSGAYGEDNLLYLPACNIVEKQLYFKVGRAYALHRGYDASEYMVKPVVLPGILYRHYVANLFDNTYHRAVARRVGANGT